MQGYSVDTVFAWEPFKQVQTAVFCGLLKIKKAICFWNLVVFACWGVLLGLAK